MTWEWLSLLQVTSAGALHVGMAGGKYISEEVVYQQTDAGGIKYSLPPRRSYQPGYQPGYQQGYQQGYQPDLGETADSQTESQCARRLVSHSGPEAGAGGQNSGHVSASRVVK